MLTPCSTNRVTRLESIMHLKNIAARPNYLLLTLFVGAVVAVTLLVSIVLAESASDYTALPHVNMVAPVQTRQVITINAPASRAWHILTDVNRWASWQKDIRQPRLHDAFRAGNSFNWKSGGLSIHSTLSVVTPYRKIIWSGPALGAFAIHSWTFSEHDGLTEVEVRESMDGWLVRLAQPIFQQGLDTSIRYWLQALKQAAEQPGQ